MKAKELKTKDKNELNELLRSERQKLFELRMKSFESRSKNVKEAREVRKNIARVLTLLKTMNPVRGRDR